MKELGTLRIFWAKPVREISVKSTNPLILRVAWSNYRRSSEACFEIVSGRSNAFKVDTCPNGDLIAITSSALPLNMYDRWSIAYFYTAESRLLKGNSDVTVGSYESDSTDENIMQSVEYVQRRSWNFYIPPPIGDIVFLAKLGGTLVGSAYYNPLSSNVDYGVHVVKQYWRRRIGTRLLSEVLNHAFRQGKRWVSVVRVIRGKKPVASDRRAIGFYEANDPSLKVNIYRLRIFQPLRS